MLNDLGIELKKARDLRGVSLQAIAEPANISVAYLQKLEGGHVGSPSPRVLRRVGLSVGVPYLRLMELAGYLDEAEIASIQEHEATPRPHPLAEQKLNQKEWQAVGVFIKALIDQRTEGNEATP